MPVGAILGAVGGLGSALIGSSAAGKAADAQTQAAQLASQTQLHMFDQVQGNEQPFLGAGTESLSQLLNALGIGPDRGTGAAGHTPYGSLTAPVNPVAPFSQDMFQQSPGYQYQLQQGQNAIQNSAAGRGGLVGGNALMALQQNGQGLANQDWYNAQNQYYQRGDQNNALQFQNRQSLFNMLQTLAGSGQNAAAHLGSLGSQTAGNIGNLQLAQGGINANNAATQGNIFGNLLSPQGSFLQGIQSMFGQGTPQLNPVNYGAINDAAGSVSIPGF